MTNRLSRRRSGTSRPAAEIAPADKQQHTETTAADIPVQWADYSGPCGRRKLPVIVVACRCSHVHTHRADTAADADGAIRRGSCGLRYRVRLRTQLDLMPSLPGSDTSRRRRNARRWAA